MDAVEPPASAPEESSPAPVQHFVSLDGVVKSYGRVTALGPITVQLDGRCTAILGPNGAGKSTLLRLLLGLTKPQAGTVHVDGEPVGPGRPAARRRIGYSPEGQTLFPGMAGWEAVAYAGKLSGLPPTAAVQRAHQVLDYVGLEGERYRDAATYSAGMRQRLKLAQALVHDPSVLILDEPTEAVDPVARRAILDLIRDLADNHGVRVILSTHLLSDAEAVADAAIVLNRGQVVANGPMAELRRASHEGYRVRVNRDVGLLGDRLKTQGIECELDGSTLTVRGVAPSDILQHAQEAGVVVRHLAPIELSLQQAFQQAVGEVAR